MEYKKYKRERDGIYISWIFTILTIVWSVFGIVCVSMYGFGWEAFAGWSVLAFLVGGVACTTIPGDEHAATKEFVIVEYERYDLSTSKYVKYYVYGRNSLRAKFILHWCTGEYIHVSTAEEIIQRETNDSYYEWFGYTTQEEVMIQIIKDIRRMMLEDKAAENIKIRNIKTHDVLSVYDLKQRVESGEFDVPEQTETDPE
jgi:hypothetical protein